MILKKKFGLGKKRVHQRKLAGKGLFDAAKRLYARIKPMYNKGKEYLQRTKIVSTGLDALGKKDWANKAKEYGLGKKRVHHRKLAGKGLFDAAKRLYNKVRPMYDKGKAYLQRTKIVSTGLDALGKKDWANKAKEYGLGKKKRIHHRKGGRAWYKKIGDFFKNAGNTVYKNVIKPVIKSGAVGKIASSIDPSTGATLKSLGLGKKKVHRKGGSAFPSPLRGRGKGIVVDSGGIMPTTINYSRMHPTGTYHTAGVPYVNYSHMVPVATGMPMVGWGKQLPHNKVHNKIIR